MSGPDTRDTVQNAISELEAVNESQSFAVLIGGEDGLECLLKAGSHRPTGMQLHLLAAHLKAVASGLDCSVSEAAQLGVNAHRQMASNAGVNVGVLVDESGD